jgi:hypothetical protein
MSIDKIIKKSEDIDLSGNDIMRITEGKTNMLSYDKLEEYNNIDEVLGPHGCVVILYQTKENTGHWVCLFKRDGNVLEFFDPYGLVLDQELPLSTYNLQRHNGVLTPHLTALIKQSSYKVSNNIHKLQEFKHDVNTCGRWVSLRVKWRSKSLSEFIKLLTTNENYNGDFWVSALTILV